MIVLGYLQLVCLLIEVVLAFEHFFRSYFCGDGALSETHATTLTTALGETTKEIRLAIGLTLAGLALTFLGILVSIIAVESTDAEVVLSVGVTALEVAFAVIE